MVKAAALERGLNQQSASSGPSADDLTEAFETFSRASVSLERAHEALRCQVKELSRRLRETEGRLRESLEENGRLSELAARRSRLEAMGRMAAEIAHEIRNPLGSLELTASLLRDDLSQLSIDAPRRELAVSILDGIRALTSVTGNLLTFTRSVSPRLETIEVENVLARTRDLVAPVLAARGLALRIEAPEGLAIEADAELLQQILLNLVQNALEASETGGIVAVSACSGPGGRIELCVRDTGCGIDRDTLPRVFDPFFTTKEQGTGLGLSVSHRLAEAQGARLEIESETGKGTTARIVFAPEKTGNDSTRSPARDAASDAGHRTASSQRLQLSGRASGELMSPSSVRENSIPWSDAETTSPRSKAPSSDAEARQSGTPRAPVSQSQWGGRGEPAEGGL